MGTQWAALHVRCNAFKWLEHAALGGFSWSASCTYMNANPQTEGLSSSIVQVLTPCRATTSLSIQRKVALHKSDLRQMKACFWGSGACMTLGVHLWMSCRQWQPGWASSLSAVDKIACAPLGFCRNQPNVSTILSSKGHFSRFMLSRH